MVSYAGIWRTHKISKQKVGSRGMKNVMIIDVSVGTEVFMIRVRCKI